MADLALPPEAVPLPTAHPLLFATRLTCTRDSFNRAARKWSCGAVASFSASAGPAVVFSADGWSSFVTAIKDGHLSS